MQTNCDNCGSRHLIRLSTVKHPAFSRPGYMKCSECNHTMPWHLDDGQHPLVSNNRIGRKAEVN